MSDEIDNLDESAETGSDEPVAGERLAKARREQQIPVLEIAKELHLDEYKVSALERNDFDVIGAAVFAKGHLRKYAQLVGVDEADVMADYYKLNRATGAPLVVSTSQRPRRVLALGPWIAVIIVFVLAATAYWWFVEREVALETADVGEVLPRPQEEVAGGTEIGDSVDDGNSEALPDEPEAGPDVEPEPEGIEPLVVPAVDNAESRLSITYSGDCWTEISDGSGRRLFFELGEAGRTVNLSGEAPFNVLFGDAANVSIELDGVPFEIPAANRRGKTVRLTINGS